MIELKGNSIEIKHLGDIDPEVWNIVASLQCKKRLNQSDQNNNETRGPWHLLVTKSNAF